MSFAGVFDAIAARYGQVVTVAKDGVTLGSGRAVLRPMLDRKSQFFPTDLGLARVEETLCLGQAGLPFSEAAGVWTVTQGETAGGTPPAGGGRIVNTTLTALRQAMTDFLAGEGIPALTAWPREPREEGTTPVAVVQIQEVRASGGGFQNYLGQTYDPAAKTWTETYGQRVGVTFALTLYSPRQAGEAGCRALADQVAATFLTGGPAGFAVEKWTLGEAAFDAQWGMFRVKLQAHCRGWLVARTQESGEIVGFAVKGEVVL